MKTVELFSGTKSFSKYAEKLGHKTFTVDNESSLDPDLTHNLLEEMPQELKDKIEQADIIWMSPPCQSLSMASGNTHWTADRQPKTQNAIIGRDLLLFSLTIAKYCEKKGKIYFIENPRARARWFLPKETRQTVWYCQYGDERAKPTDIWTNLKGWTAKMCKNNNPDCNHQRAPRGSKTGTQGMKGAKSRGEIPQGLFKELFNHIKRGNTMGTGFKCIKCGTKYPYEETAQLCCTNRMGCGKRQNPKGIVSSVCGQTISGGKWYFCRSCQLKKKQKAHFQLTGD